jgi:hypothetical protein
MYFVQWKPLAPEGGTETWIEKTGKTAVDQGAAKAALLR